MSDNWVSLWEQVVDTRKKMTGKDLRGPSSGRTLWVDVEVAEVVTGRKTGTRW